MKITVMKFGGSCFKDSEAFGKIKSITEIYKEDRKIYVASALQGVTNMLVSVGDAANNNNSQEAFTILKSIEKKHYNTIDEIFSSNGAMSNKAKKFIKKRIGEINLIITEIEEFGMQPFFSDYILSYGERMSTFLLSLYLEMQNFDTEYFVGEDLIITDDNFTDALPNYKFTFNRFKQRIAPKMNQTGDSTIFCVTGFIGRNKMGYTTTLGRGGSDFTATILAKASYYTIKNVEVKVILWKDVDGILTTNPKYVDAPVLVKKLNYKEAAESAFFGAKILHPKCLAAIEKEYIDVEIRNFDKPNETEKYSVISNETDKGNLKGISTIEEMAMISVKSGTLVNVPGVLGTIFSIMGGNGISVNMVTQSSSEVNTTFVVEKQDGDKAIDCLKNHPQMQEWYTIEKEIVGIIAIIGDQIHKSNHKIFSALAKNNIDVLAIAQSSDDLNVSICVATEHIPKAVDSINKEFQ